MSKLPVKINYTFDIDLDITENLIPFVNTSLLINNIPEEEIHFYSHSEDEKRADTYFYWDAWYVYGDGELLYVGRKILDVFGGDIIPANYWRAKYLTSGDVQWKEGEYHLYWYLCDDDKYRIATPEAEQYDSYITMPYSTITVKRNTGENLTTIQNMNPTEEVPDNTTFPDLEQQRRNVFNPVINMKKVWIKINDNKYKLKIWGSVSKLTSREVGDLGDYEEWDCVYVPHYFRVWIPGAGKYRYFSGYKLSSQNINAKKKDLYEGQATPNNLKLVVSYLNNKGYYETRKYKA